jgi:predicted nucleic acid-binding protein
VLARIEEHEGELATCAIVWHELRYGAARPPASKKRRAIETYLEEVVRMALPILPSDGESATWHAREPQVRSLELPWEIDVVARFRAGTSPCYSWTIFESPRPQYRSFSSRL